MEKARDCQLFTKPRNKTSVIFCEPVIQPNPLLSLARSQTDTCNGLGTLLTTPTAARTVVKRLLQHLWERRGCQKRISLGGSKYQKAPTRTMKLVTPLQYSSCQVEVLRWIQTGVELRLRISCQIWSTNVRLKTSFGNFGYPELVGIVWSPAWCHMACQCTSANSLPKACCRDLNMAECCCCHYPLIILITW